MSHNDSSVSRPQCGLPFLTGFVPIPDRHGDPRDLHHLVCTNEEPLPILRDQISSILQQEKARLVAIEANMTRLSASLQTLKSMKKDSLSALKSCRTALSPVRRLPSELLQEIIAFAVADRFSRKAHQNERKLAANTAWIISCVCRRWNSLCNSYAQRVETDVATVAIEPNRHDHSLSVTFTGTDPTFKPYKFSQLLPILLANSGKWKTVTIAPSPALLDLLGPMTGRLPAVEQLDVLQTGEADGSGLGECFSDAFSEMPHLTTLTGSARFMESLSLPLHQIQHFTTAGESAIFPRSTIYDIWDILQHMPHLVTCDLSYDHLNSEEYSDLPALTLPNLTSLSVSIYAKNVLRNLTLPSLRQCTVLSQHTYEDSDYDYSEGAEDRLSHFLSCLPSLTDLRLCGNEASTEFYIDLLGSLPGLHSLYLEDWYIYNDFSGHVGPIIERLVSVPPAKFLPNLQDIDIEVTNFDADNRWDIIDEQVERVQNARLSVRCSLDING